MVIETTADSLETETSEMDKEEDKLAAQTMINGTGIWMLPRKTCLSVI